MNQIKVKNKKLINLTVPKNINFDDIMNIFSKYGDLDIKTPKGSFDYCDLVITYDYEEDYYVVKGLLKNEQIRLKNGCLPYYKKSLIY